MRNLCRHTNTLAQRGVRVDGFAYVNVVCAHLDGQGDFADHVACMLAYDVADGEDVGHVRAHLDVDVDEASVGDGYACFIGGDLFAVGGAAYGLQHQVVGLGAGAVPPCTAGGSQPACGNACVALTCSLCFQRA
jgi:hypothetical protein